MNRKNQRSPAPPSSPLKRLAAFDLNLLVAFQALTETRHVGRAAAALGLSQPALSHALRRLREALEDPLFVRTPRGVQPTAVAERIAPAVSRLLASLQDDVLAPGGFDPQTLDRMFRVQTTGLLEVLLMPPLLERLAREAPRVRVSIRLATPEFPEGALERGELDLAIAGFYTKAPAGIRRQVVVRDQLLCAVRAGHPRLKSGRAPSVARFCEERHLLIAPGGDLDGPVDRALAAQKRRRFVAAGVAEFLAAGPVIARTDLVLTAPAALLAHFAQTLPLTTFPPPIKLPPVVIGQHWHERSHADQAHSWFRGVIAETLAGLA